jgi:hypothetical protein
MVGYLLKNTVSDYGTVTRGVCQQKSGRLARIKETYKIKKYPDGSITDTEDPACEKPLEPDTLVSMNFWGFTPWIFDVMENYFDTFLRSIPEGNLKSECVLPVMIDDLISTGVLSVPVLSTDAVWFGITYREDKAIVSDALKHLHDIGNYPPSLRK